MKETGEIIGIGKGRATVRVNRRSACGSCRACGMKPEEPHIDFDVPVGEGLKAGDRVEIEIPEGGVAKMSLAAYALPLALGLIPFAAVYFSSKNELAALLSLFGGIGIGCVVLRILEKKVFSRKPQVRIVSSPSDKEEKPDEPTDF